MEDFTGRIDSSWTLFLDRDGVINERIMGGYVTDPKGFHFLPGVPEAIASFSKRFGKIIIVTNQQGIGKGLMTTEHVQTLHEYMLQKIEEQGGRVDAIYFCPDLKTKPDNCRKPGIYMALQAQSDFPEIDFSKSIMVGDSVTDMEFGRKAGMFTVYAGLEQTIEADAVVSGLKALAAIIH
ncbi:MAG: HAD family hydrolase [Bacteroidales bacterium]|nr:HAD family hydrolase [Bacteroidales bacterium]